MIFPQAPFPIKTHFGSDLLFYSRIEKIQPKDNNDYLLGETSKSFNFIAKRGVSSKGRHADDLEYTANPTKSWILSILKMEYITGDIDISRTSDETGDRELKKRVRDSITLFKEENSCGNENRCLFWFLCWRLRSISTNEDKTFRNIVLDVFKAVEEGVQDSAYEIVKYVLTHSIVAGIQDSILSLNLCKCSF